MRLFTELRYSAAAEGKIFAALLNSSRANAVGLNNLAGALEPGAGHFEGIVGHDCIGANCAVTERPASSPDDLALTLVEC